MSVDIRKGDLVKATNRQHPEETVQGRVQVVNSGYLDTLTKTFARDRWDFEVLDRPLPPIDEELLHRAIDAYCAKRGLSADIARRGSHYPDSIQSALVDVINLVREYDRKNTTKENA